MSVVNPSVVELLRKALSSNASVNLPGDPDYSNKRWARNAEKTAAIVTHPSTAEDVAQIIAFAQGKSPYDAQPKLDLAIKVSEDIILQPRRVPQHFGSGRWTCAIWCFKLRRWCCHRSQS
jgi:hypothetical protein